LRVKVATARGKPRQCIRFMNGRPWSRAPVRNAGRTPFAVKNLHEHQKCGVCRKRASGTWRAARRKPAVLATCSTAPKKGNPGEIRAGVPLAKHRGCVRRQPVGRVRAAAPGYHYTLDHPLPLKPPRTAIGQPARSQAGSSLSSHASLTQHAYCSQLAKKK
jgi:hypothetical protein